MRQRAGPTVKGGARGAPSKRDRGRNSADQETRSCRAPGTWPTSQCTNWEWPSPVNTFGQHRGRHVLLRKEVIQPHLPVRLPCYDFTPITNPTFGSSFSKRVRPLTSGVADFRGVTGGVYKARERIHPGVADPGLLATPPSWSRVADSNPN